MIPAAFLLGLFSSGFITNVLNGYFGQWTLAAAIIVFFASMFFARVYMALGFSIAPIKNWFIKLVIALPFVLFMYILGVAAWGTGTGLDLESVMKEYNYTSSNALSVKWNLTITIIGYFYGLVQSFKPDKQKK